MKEESKENDNISIQKEKDTSKKDIQDLNKKKKNSFNMYIILCCYVLINFIRLNSFYNKQYKKRKIFLTKNKSRYYKSF